MTCVAIAREANINIVRISVGRFINSKLSYYGSERKQNSSCLEYLQLIRPGNKSTLYCVIGVLQVVDQTVVVLFMCVIVIHSQHSLQKTGVLTLFQDIAKFVVGKSKKPLP